MLSRQFTRITHDDDPQISKKKAAIVRVFNDLPFGTAIPTAELHQIMSHHYGRELFDLSSDKTYASKIDPTLYCDPNKLFTSKREFILAALLNDPTLINSFKSFCDLLSIKRASTKYKTKADLSSKLKDLPVDHSTLQEIHSFLVVQRAMKPVQDIQVNYSNAIHVTDLSQLSIPANLFIL